ncbi:MAG: family 16 glycosylhydrolase [Sphingobacterium sp.]
MKPIFLIIFLLFLSFNSYSQSYKTKYINEGYTLVWSDEFNQKSLNTQNWSYILGWRKNEQLDWCENDNVYLENGCLVIEARKEENGKLNPEYSSKSKNWQQQRRYIQYTSGAIETKNKRSWKYGRFEMRAKFDSELGLWPAFWTLGVEKNWPYNGEIDIMEYYRGNLLANIGYSLKGKHPIKWSSKRRKYNATKNNSLSHSFHVWRMDWDQDQIVIYLDNIQLNKLDISKLTDINGFNPFRQPHYIILNLALGGINGGNISKTVLPKEFVIDYVRVYQKK